jgi:hypothetical protein
MALNEEMRLAAIKEAEDIDAGVDRRSKKEILSEQMSDLKSAAIKTGKFVGETAIESIPGVSEGIAVRNVSRDLKEGDYVGAGIEGVAGLAGLAPAGGDLVAKGLRKFNKTRKAYKLFVKGEDGELYPLFVDANKPVKKGEFLEANFPDVAFKGKRKEGSQESFYVPTKGAKRSKGEKAKGTGDSIIIPDEATRKKLIKEGFITERTKRTKEAPFGRVTAVAARPGWHASQAPVATHLGPQDLKVSKKEAEKLVAAGVTPEAIKRRGNQFYVKRRAEDQVFAEVDMADDVDYQSMLAKEGRSDINDRVPKGGSYRYSDGQADSDQWVVGGDMKVNRVLSREETRAIQKEMGVVDLPYRDEVETILERKFAEGGMVMDDYLVAKTIDQTQDFAKGGMSKQMELFEPVEGAFDEGGLMDEGGTVDPESGNDVPAGSTQEEVRDDIPAQLSEGEFVLPADVVRYHGLEKIMALRDEAKAGLAKMEAMGQMGNSEEATIPDDVPFSMEDLDMEDDGVLEYQVGGFVPSIPAGIPTPQQQAAGISSFTPSQFTNYQPQFTPYTPPPITPTTGLTQQFTPTIDQQAPTFTNLTGAAQPSPGGYDEMRTYVNDAGMEMQIPFKDGKPIYPIPEGYKKKSEAVDTTRDVKTETTQTAAPEQQDSSDEPSDPFAGKQTVNLGGTVITKENVEKEGRTGVSSFKPGQVKGTTRYSVGSASSVTGDLSKKTGSGSFSNLKDSIAEFGRGLANQDQKTLTKEDGSKITLSETLFESIMGDRFSGKTNQVLADIFEVQSAIEKNFGENYNKDLDNRQAKEMAKAAGIEYKGQSLAELIATGVDSQGNRLKDSFDAGAKSKKTIKEQMEDLAKQKSEQKKAERLAAEAAAAKAERERQQLALERAFRNVSDSDDSGPDPSDMSGGEDTGDVGGGPSGPTGSQQEVDDFESDLG